MANVGNNNIVPYKPYRITDSKNLPLGAVQMSRQQVIDYHRQKVKSHRPYSEVKILDLSWVYLATLPTLTTSYFDYHYRKVFNFGSHKLVQSFLAVVCSSVCLTVLSHHVINEEVVAGEVAKPMWLKQKSSAYMALTGVLFPVGAVMVNVLGLSHSRERTLNAYKIGRQIARKFPVTNFFLILGLNCAVGYGVVKLEMDAFYKLHTEQQNSAPKQSDSEIFVQ